MLPFYTTRDQNLVVHLYPVDQVFETLMDLFYPRSQSGAKRIHGQNKQNL